MSCPEGAGRSCGLEGLAQKAPEWNPAKACVNCPARIINELELAAGQRIVSGETLVFFDEIQECPKALAALRYFYEEMPGLYLLRLKVPRQEAYEACTSI